MHVSRYVIGQLVLYYYFFKVVNMLLELYLIRDNITLSTLKRWFSSF